MWTKIVGAYILTLWVGQEVHFESDLLIIPAYHALFYHAFAVWKLNVIWGETKPQAVL